MFDVQTAGVRLLSASDRDAVCTSLLRKRIGPLGLAEIAPRRWIDGSKPPVRRLFELQLLKGASLKACWGFSLDFVPHFSGGRCRWHRSDKVARLDVIVDPAAQPEACFLYGANRFRSELGFLLEQAVPAAKRDWARGATFAGMLDIIREIRERGTNCFGYRNYTQLPLACMFLAARVGDVALAERELEQYLQGDSLDEREANKLRRFVRECKPPEPAP
jgi:hypothetical protein